MKKDTVEIGDTVYITNKYLTSGIIEAKVVGKATTRIFDAIEWSVNGEFKEKATSKEWFHTYSEAVDRVLELIVARRKALIKQLNKLDKLENEITENGIKLVKCFMWRNKVVKIYRLLSNDSLTSLRNYSYIVDNSDLSGVGYTSLKEVSTAAKRAIDSQHIKED